MAYICCICDRQEKDCQCAAKEYCAFCQGSENVRLCEDGQYYCASCREACDYMAQP
jgi:hypothetical protein